MLIYIASRCKTSNVLPGIDNSLVYCLHKTQHTYILWH